MIASFFLFILLATAVVYDFVSEKIPNYLIVIGLFAGVVYRLIFCRDAAVGKIFFDLFFPFFLFFIFFVIKAFGAGDIKLLMICGVFLGTSDNLWCIALALAAAAMIGLVRLLIHKTLLTRFGSLFRYFKKLALHYKYRNGEIEPYLAGERLRGFGKIHFSLPILIGAVMTVWIAGK